MLYTRQRTSSNMPKLYRAFRLITFTSVLLLFLSFTFIVVSAVSAQEGDPQPPSDDDVNAVAKQLYCPVCENVPLDVCPTQACEEWRQLISDKLALGWNDEQVKVYFVEQYGDRVLAEPPRRGLNWLVYVIPPLIFLVGIFVLYKALRAWKKPVEPEQASTSTSADSDEYIQRLEEDLKNL